MNNTGVEITAGLGGFLVLFFLAIAVWFLGWDLNRRLRRLRHQEQLRLEEERLTREQAESATQPAAGEQAESAANPAAGQPASGQLASGQPASGQPADPDGQP